MYLSKLVMYGFKSFADKTEFHFDKGISAIVGPNGCGKSNIVDAIRWVLGEQKTKTLRSSKMEDVIFGGTEKRTPYNFAEVSLVVNNNRGVLPEAYPEVEISRKLMRDGNSEYRINRKPCRLKDIHSLFYDTGMGADSYSLIESKMIDSILSDNDEERRVMFEEAAGISKYRTMRKETVSQLNRTETDLGRINDTVIQVEKSVRMLERHVKKARMKRSVRDELRSIEVSYNGRIYEKTMNSLQNGKIALKELTTEKESLSAGIAKNETEIANFKHLASEKEEKLQEIHAIESSKEKEITELQRNHSVAVNTIEQTRKSIERLREDTKASQEKIVQLDEGKRESERRIADLKTRIYGLKEALETRKVARKNLNIKILDKNREGGDFQLSLIENIEKSASLNNELSEVRTNAENLIEQADSINSEAGVLSEENKTLAEKSEKLADELKALNDEHSNFIESRKVLREKIESLEESYHGILDTEKKLESAIYADDKQLDLLEGLKKKHEGYKEGVKFIIEDCRSEGVFGIVADHIKVDPEFVDAIENSMGSRLQNIIAGNSEVIQELRQKLTEEEKGMVGFINMEKVRNSEYPVLDRSFAETDGVIKRAIDCVSASDGYTRLIDLLFGRTLIVRDRHKAAEIISSAPGSGIKCITPEGGVYDSRGYVIEGYRSNEVPGLLSREKFILSLRENLEKNRKLLDSNNDEKTGMKQTISDAQKALIELDEKLSEGRSKQQERQGSIEGIDNRIMENREKERSLLEKASVFRKKSEQLREKEDEIKKELQNLAFAKEEIEAGQKKTVSEKEELEKEYREIDEAVRKYENDLVGFELQHEKAMDDFNRMERDVKEYTVMISRKQEEITKDHTLIEDKESSIGTYEAEIRIKIDEKESVKNRKEEVRKVLLEFQEKIDEKSGIIREANGKNSELSEKMTEIEVSVSRGEDKCRSIRERMYEEYEIDIDTWKIPEEEKDPEDDNETVSRRIKELRGKLKRIGEVNMSVLEDYEKESAVLEDLNKQKTDLEKAYNDIKSTITRLDREAREKFKSTFEVVRKNFRDIFTMLFNGGEVNLDLEEGADPLEARIEINARTPGKKMRGVTALSGGERALTAVSLLFALYLVKPSPYCILDEIDGPLDDANVSRFVNLLRRFSEQTQFIVVTHNKGTMERADILYGVTQEEKGVSRLIAVNIEKAMEAIT